MEAEKAVYAQEGVERASPRSARVADTSAARGQGAGAPGCTHVRALTWVTSAGLVQTAAA